MPQLLSTCLTCNRKRSLYLSCISYRSSDIGSKTLPVHLCLQRTTDTVPMQVLEKLYRLKWGPLDGLGTLIISPTRELALQIFDELRKIGKKHEFSAGLLIGGKKVKEEQERVHGKHRILASAHLCLHARRHAPTATRGVSRITEPSLLCL